MAAVLLGFPQAALAHDLGVECSLRAGAVHIEAFFDDDTPARKARVEVFDSQEKCVAEGTTDAKGLWSFPQPGPGKYQVRVDAGAGHLAKTTITIPEAASDSPSQTVSAGPTREEFTRFPWVKLGLGLGLLFVATAAFLIARRRAAVHVPRPDETDRSAGFEPGAKR